MTLQYDTVFSICKTDDWFSNSWEKFTDYTTYPKCFSWCFNECHWLCYKCAVHDFFYSMSLPSYGFLNASDEKVTYPPWEPPPSMFAIEASQNTSSLESARLPSFFNAQTISSLFILLTNLFAVLASSMVGFSIFPSKLQHSKRISGLVCVANQLNCPIKAQRLCIPVSSSKSFLSFFPTNFKDYMEST